MMWFEWGHLVSVAKRHGLSAELARGGLGNLVLRLVSAMLGFITALVLARLLGAERYGIYAYVLALVSVLAVPAQFGLPALVLRETAAQHVHHRWALMKGLWRYANVAATIISIVIVFFGIAAVSLLTDHLTEEQTLTFVWGLVLVPLVVLGDLRAAALQGLRKVVQGRLPEYLIRPGALLLLLVAASFVAPRVVWSATLIMQLQILAAAIAFAIGAYLLRRQRPAELQAAAPEYEPRRWFFSIVPLALSAGMQLINHYADIVMLGLFRTAAEVGIYRVAVMSTSLVVLGLQIVNMVVAPHFSRLHAIGDTASLQRLATTSARLGVLVAFPVVTVFLVAGDKFLGIAFGMDFAAGYAALSILAIGQFVNAACGSVGYLLNMTGHERDAAWGMAIAACISVVLNLVLIPPFGMVGAATSTSITVAVWNVMLSYSVRRRLGIDSMALRIWRNRATT
jgi:O-antigen/teichoic acid export membrane protein